ncbi:helix-turn-helix domain-containing protein [Paraburkholderia sp. BCC1885]|uniref:helix-turn-helix domain-containing protein n=1 Tax=Paraburkholderia sp. BCC1885 TaxID=2562669 RepID=UPI0021B40C0F|nr:helix-turn-helix transcriptional regulator [Paraburkholderia sp. BCC1885]
MSDIDQLARSIGSAIAARRKELDMTQEQLSELIQIEQPSLSRIERGTLVPSIERLAGIAETLRCRLADLLSTAGTAPLDRAIRIQEKLSPLSPVQQELIERIIDDAVALLDAPASRRPSRSGSRPVRKGP